jgi:hypothetical protein
VTFFKVIKVDLNNIIIYLTLDSKCNCFDYNDRMITISELHFLLKEASFKIQDLLKLIILSD